MTSRLIRLASLALTSFALGSGCGGKPAEVDTAEFTPPKQAPAEPAPTPAAAEPAPAPAPAETKPPM